MTFQRLTSSYHGTTAQKQPHHLGITEFYQTQHTTTWRIVRNGLSKYNSSKIDNKVYNTVWDIALQF